MASGYSILFHLIIGLCLAVSDPGDTGATGPRTSSTDSTVVILLGTGNPYPDPLRQGPATAVVSGTQVLLFDAGSGVMRQLRAANLPINGVTALFVTHLHTDHTLGYPDLIFTSWVMRRAGLLHAYGPKGLQRMTDYLILAYREDINIRTDGLEREVPDGYQVAVHEIAPGVVYDSAGVRVTAIPVQHGEWREAYGYRIDTPDRSIVISGDTRASEEIVKAAEGVDILIHEAYPEARVVPEDRPGGHLWPQYLKEYHISDIELGELAARITPRLLLLSHVVWLGGTEEEVIRGIRKGGYRGPVKVGRDLGRY